MLTFRKFRHLKAKNTYCFGPEGIEIYFDNYDNIVNIRGVNLDNIPENDHGMEDSGSSNGVGKSSIPGIIVYAVFGKTLKQPTKVSHTDIIHNKIGKKLMVEFCWDTYKVVRCRKPDSLKFYEEIDGEWVDITLGTAPLTQELIEKRFGMNFSTCINVLVFTDSNDGAFLECGTPDKRKIVENLLGLEVYREDLENAKALKKNITESIKVMRGEYQILSSHKDAADNRLGVLRTQQSTWDNTKQREYAKLSNDILIKEGELKTTDIGAALMKWQEAQDKLVVLAGSIQETEDNKNLIDNLIAGARVKFETARVARTEVEGKIRKLHIDIASIKDSIKSQEKLIKDLEQKKGSECPTCFGEVLESNYQKVTLSAQNKIQEFTSFLTQNETDLTVLQTDLDGKVKTFNTIEEAITTANKKYQAVVAKLASLHSERSVLSKISKPEDDNSQRILEDIERLKAQLAEKVVEMQTANPYTPLLATAEMDLQTNAQECERKKAMIEAKEGELPYFDYCVDAYGDNGIRKNVIKRIVPTLNKRIAYWLQFLTDNKISMVFDESLEVTIERNPADGDPFLYYCMSNGERRKLNLSVSQAFAFLMVMNCGASTSAVFLDEVTGGAIDRYGIEGVWNMITEMAKDTQVFITTHDKELLAKLEGCQTINLEKKNGFTKLVA